MSNFKQDLRIRPFSKVNVFEDKLYSDTGIFRKAEEILDITSVTSGLPSYSGYAESGFINTSGDAMTGFLTLNANPVNSGHASTKSYVDTIGMAAVSSGASLLNTYSGYADTSFVGINSSQTISGQKTFNQNILVSGIQALPNNDLRLTATGTGEFVISLAGEDKFRIDDLGYLFLKSHSGYTGSNLVIGTSGIQSTDNGDTTIFTINLEDDSAYWVDFYVIGRRILATPFRIRMEHNIACVYRELGGAATLVGTVSQTVSRSLNAGAYAVGASVSGNNLNITVNGDTAETVNWICRVEYQKVSLST